MASSERRLAVRVLLQAAACTTGLLALYYVLPLGRLHGAASAVLLIGAVIGIAVVFLLQLRAILRSDHPGMRAVRALSVILPYFLTTFATIYYVVDWHAPGSFNQSLTRTDALYFTVTTFTTVGYGDITPLTAAARIVVMIQMLSDLAIIGFGAKVLVEAVQLRRRDVTGPGPGGRPDNPGR